jgi:hypothetical protein
MRLIEFDLGGNILDGMPKIGEWKRNLNTGFEFRWDAGVSEVHIAKVAANMPANSCYLFPDHLRAYEVVHSGAVGGFYSLGEFDRKSDALAAAIKFMKKYPNGG